MTTSAVLFDLDGTLADTVPLIAHHIAATITEFAAPVEPQAIVPYIGRPLEVPLVTFGRLSPNDPLVSRMASAYHSTWSGAVDERGPELLFPGTRPMLSELRAAGLGVGVVTAKTMMAAHHLIDALGIADLLDVLIGTDLVAHGKPAPDSALLALERLGADGATSWYVGDATSDIEMARAARLHPMGVTTGAATREELAAAGAEVVVGGTDEVAAHVLSARL